MSRLSQEERQKILSKVEETGKKHKEYRIEKLFGDYYWKLYQEMKAEKAPRNTQGIKGNFVTALFNLFAELGLLLIPRSEIEGLVKEWGEAESHRLEYKDCADQLQQLLDRFSLSRRDKYSSTSLGQDSTTIKQDKPEEKPQ